jgi:hypothetical protein
MAYRGTEREACSFLRSYPERITCRVTQPTIDSRQNTSAAPSIGLGARR